MPRRIDEFRTVYRILEALTRFTARTITMIPLISAFLLGLVVNEVSDPGKRDFGDVFAGLYGLDRGPIVWINIVATALLILVPLLHVTLRSVTGNTSQVVRLSRRLPAYVDPSVRQFSEGRIAWGPQLVLQSCPKITEGWRSPEVRITLDPTVFAFAREDDAAGFERWLAASDDDRVARGEKFRLMENPDSFVDDPGLRLRVQETTYAQAVYVNRDVSTDDEQRNRLIGETLHGRLRHPHIFALHATVVTADGWILLTHRSHKVAYEPGTWSCSIEEQLAKDDLDAADAEVLDRWVRRALIEELGLSAHEARQSQARALAVFLEGHHLNIGLVTLVHLPIDREELNSILAHRPRQDYEFQAWDFLRWSQLAAELVEPTRVYHTSAGLRMFFAGLVKFGVFGFHERIDRALR
ncbi:hypothetical protein GCM10010168_28170 [Actinoplanes ianthinogenes]|uniref:Nudix hydrolase domain-containing protein n=1 Tax=Actinoplanes ianthinogenes TaxID=122358 RepID=A0ABN6C4C3_9ACTN|nr:hypothetical protein [Actinoplanes ianthinogenes]BCJ39958.1 hypothetical protein Aiant_06150 [Actinoplanes ianthinogenes]GGR09284.1 hypothetical protein GCM10010168_28170 [Actinoplanes ianthinogenes]